MYICISIYIYIYLYIYIYIYICRRPDQPAAPRKCMGGGYNSQPRARPTDLASRQ